MLDSIQKLLEHAVKDLYSAEKQLLRALPRMARAADTPELAEAFEDHIMETEDQLQRLEQVAEILDIRPSGKRCLGMAGLIEEGAEVLRDEGIGIDEALIMAAQKVEHYEISAYGSAIALAERLGEDEVVRLLEESLEEEKLTDKKLTGISMEILPGIPEHQEA